MSDTLDNVVKDGVHFLQSLTTHYGAERGMEMWEAMGAALGREVKGKVFFALMTGQTASRVTFKVEMNGAYNPNAVACIKAIRGATGFGLKEAKDLYDASKNVFKQVDCLTNEHANILAKDLRNLGCRIG